MNETPRSFDVEWQHLSRYVHHLLGSKGVYGPLREDIVQETGLKLFQVWDRVDHERPVKGLATTIALNVLRDEMRRSKRREVLGEIPETTALADVEQAGLARMELARVGRALTKLSPDHRLVLLHEVREEEAPAARGNAAMKMLRIRARRRLVTILEASAVMAAGGLMKLRRTVAIEAVSAVSAVAAVTIAAGAPVAGPVAVPGARERGVHRSVTVAELAGRHDAPAATRDAMPVPARSERPHRSTIPSASATAEGAGAEREPLKIEAGGERVEARADVSVNDVSVAVGESQGPVPVCAEGVPGVPAQMTCGGSGPDH